MILKRRAQEILSLADKTKRDFLRGDENLEGVISVGSGEFLSTRILTDCIAQFQKKHPLVQFEIYSGNAGNKRGSGGKRGIQNLFANGRIMYLDDIDL